MESEIRRVFDLGKTRDVTYRLDLLRSLKSAILNREDEVLDALKKDLGKCEWESRATETSLVVNEINHSLKNLVSWSSQEKVSTSITSQPARSFIRPCPRGTVFIMAPWNYPFQLCMSPLVGAIGAGNTVVLKPSEMTPNVSAVIGAIISEAFPSGEAICVQGGADVAQDLLKQPFSHFFFTGGARVGKLVAHAAAEQLSACTLELGGKSPCIVDRTADIRQAARRIAWGKAMNAGQTCVAPDFILVHADVHDELVQAIVKSWREFYGEKPDESPDYGRIVSLGHFNRLRQMMVQDHGTFVGGRSSQDDLYIEPTIVTNIDLSHPLMQEEIFGPILPVLKWTNREDLRRVLDFHPNPLALYVFTADGQFSDSLLNERMFGGACVNHVAHHVASLEMPFGGIKGSGIGHYHGKFGFDTFSHFKAILDASPTFDLRLKYPPYGKRARWLKWLYR